MMREEIIGNARLILGDCRDVLPTLSGVDAVVTDPPYGIGLETKTSDFRDSRHFDNGESLRASLLYDDDEARIAILIRTIMPMILKVAKRALVFCGPKMLWNYPEPASVGSVFTPNGAGRTAWGFQCTHPILFYGKDPFLQDGKGGRPNSLRDEQPNRETIDHPCPKPIRWMDWAVWRASRDGESVCDPFMGSGTTGVACARLRRRFIGIEIHEPYFEIACLRIEQAQRQGDMFRDAVA